jgi:signal transduction histidine kinase
MQSAEQVLHFVEVIVYVVLMLQVALRRQIEEAEEYLIAFLGLSVIPTLLLLTQLMIRTIPGFSNEILSTWTRIVPALAFGALTLAFVRQTRWANAWLLVSIGLFGILVALQFGLFAQPPAATVMFRVLLWGLALGVATGVVLLTYRRQTSPLHRNRLHYWFVIIVLLIASEGALVATAFTAQMAARVLNWMAAGLATYVVLQVHPPDLRTLVRQTFRFLALTALLSVIFFGILMVVQRVHWPTINQRDTFLLTGVIAMVMAILLPSLSGISISFLNRLIFGADYDEREVVRNYSQSVSNILDIDRLAAVSFDVINKVFDLERGAMMLVQYSGGGHSTILPVRGHGNVSTQLVDLETFGTLMNRLRQGAPLTQFDIDVLPTYRRISEAEREWLSALQMELYVPIQSQDEVIGLLALGPKRSGEPFRRGDLNLLSTLADQTVAALKNAQMVQELRRLNLDISQLNTELESMNRTKTDFINITSHELRTPLSQVNGYSQMLAEELSSSEPYSEYVSGLLTGTARLMEIVNLMLDVSRLDVGALTLNLASVKLDKVIQQAVDEWSPALEERGHTLVTDGLEALPGLEGDKDRLQQAFSQLINNAIKYTPDGGLIEISGEAHAESSGLYIEVVVEDNGIGIDSDDQHKIFDKFYRTGDLMKHSTGKTKFKGAGPGLGLSLVRGIVNAHGGRVWVESPGHDEETCPGSRFHVVLPSHPAEYDPSMAKTMIHRGPLGRLRSQQNKTSLH